MILVKKRELETESGKMKLIVGMEKQVVRPPLAVRAGKFRLRIC